MDNGLEKYGNLNNRQAFSAVRLVHGRGLCRHIALQINILMTTESHNVRFICQGSNVKEAEAIDRSIKRNFA